jgi:hypothetical protein
MFFVLGLILKNNARVAKSAGIGAVVLSNTEKCNPDGA